VYGILASIFLYRYFDHFTDTRYAVDMQTIRLSAAAMYVACGSMGLLSAEGLNLSVRGGPRNV